LGFLQKSATSIFCSAAISMFADAQDFGWAIQQSGNDYESVYQIVEDDFGNIYEIGNFWATVDFDPSVNSYNLTSLGLTDNFIGKLDRRGILSGPNVLAAPVLKLLVIFLLMLPSESMQGGNFNRLLISILREILTILFLPERMMHSLLHTTMMVILFGQPASEVRAVILSKAWWSRMVMYMRPVISRGRLILIQDLLFIM
jgi:hypothetical protein